MPASSTRMSWRAALAAIGPSSTASTFGEYFSGVAGSTFCRPSPCACAARSARRPDDRNGGRRSNWCEKSRPANCPGAISPNSSGRCGVEDDDRGRGWIAAREPLSRLNSAIDTKKRSHPPLFAGGASKGKFSASECQGDSRPQMPIAKHPIDKISRRQNSAIRNALLRFVTDQRLRRDSGDPSR